MREPLHHFPIGRVAIGIAAALYVLFALVMIDSGTSTRPSLPDLHEYFWHAVIAGVVLAGAAWPWMQRWLRNDVATGGILHSKLIAGLLLGIGVGYFAGLALGSMHGRLGKPLLMFMVLGGGIGLAAGIAVDIVVARLKFCGSDVQ